MGWAAKLESLSEGLERGNKGEHQGGSADNRS